MLPLDCVDTVVVGAGMAGLSVAISATDEVLLLEAGIEEDTRHKNLFPEQAATDLWHRPETDPTFQRYWSSQRPPHFVRGSGLRHRVGGRSLYWHGVCLPIESRALDAGDWPSGVVRDLTAPTQVPGSYASTTKYLNDWMAAEGAEFGVAACRGPRERSLIDWTARAGFAAAAVPQAARTRLVGNEIRQIPYSPWSAWRVGQVKIVTGYRVRKILSRQGVQELTLESAGGITSLRARRVILAAGTFENTRLVGELLLDLRGERTVTFTGLNDHIVQGFVATVPTRQLQLDRTPGRAFCYAPALTEASSNLFWDVLPTSYGDGERLAVWTMGEKLPGESAITISRGYHGGPSEVVVEKPVTGADLQVVEQQSRLLARTAERLLDVAGATAWISPEDYVAGGPSWMAALSQAEGSADRRRARIFPYVYPLGSVDHESGTLPLGKVLDEAGRLPEAPGVSVVGPATFPRSGAANPSLTTLALAHGHLARLGTEGV